MTECDLYGKTTCFIPGARASVLCHLWQIYLSAITSLFVMHHWHCASEVARLSGHCILHMSDGVWSGTAVPLLGHSWECCKSSKRKGGLVRERLTVKESGKDWIAGERETESEIKRGQRLKRKVEGQKETGEKCNAPRPEPDRQSHSGQWRHQDWQNWLQSR